VKRLLCTATILLLLTQSAFAQSKVTALTELTAPLSSDLLYVVDDPAGTALSKKITFSNAAKGMSSTNLTDTANILYEGELDTFSELNDQIADQTLIHSGSNIATATDLAANGANCSVGTQFAVGVDEGGVAECEAITDADVPDDITVDLAATATDLAANGSNCSAGSYALGVGTDGASESCTDATTEINSVINGAGGTNLSCSSEQCNVDDSFVLNTGDTITNATASSALYINQTGTSTSAAHSVYSNTPQTTVGLVTNELADGGSNKWVMKNINAGIGSNTVLSQDGILASNQYGLKLTSGVAQTNSPLYYGAMTSTSSTKAVMSLLQQGEDAPHMNFTGDPTNTTKTDGDLWYNGTNLNFYDGSTTYDVLATGGSPGADSIGTSELNDGADTPSTGECLAVASDTAEIEYISCGAGGGDSVTVNSTGADTTANLLDGDIDFTLADGGAGGPDDITATVACTGCIDATDMGADSVGESELIEAMNFSATGLWSFLNSAGAGGLTDYDISLGDTDGSPTYGIARLGDSTWGRSSYSGGSLDL